MAFIESFEPVIGTNPRVLILGSMPGVASLNAHQYYAHPRNAFWSVMAEVFELDWHEDYHQRIQQLNALPIILWDVLKSCHRERSLDSAIGTHQLEANDIASLLNRYPSIGLIVFNGATAEKYFKQTVLPTLPENSQLEMVRLPSTSPAHASKNLQQKISDWKIIKSLLI